MYVAFRYRNGAMGVCHRIPADEYTVSRFMRKRWHIVFRAETRAEAEDYAKDLAYELGQDN